MAILSSLRNLYCLLQRGLGHSPQRSLVACEDKNLRVHAMPSISKPAARQYFESDFKIEDIAGPAEAALAAQALLSSGLGDLKQFPAGNWEHFHAKHSSARFFKERRYIVLAFPVLANEATCRHIVELGCGCGAAIVPILKANHKARATVCDVSESAIASLGPVLLAHEVAPERVAACVHDITTPSELVSSADADACLLVFTLSSVPPHAMESVLRLAWSSLKQGGMLLVRDYGRYDMTALRFPPEQRLAENLYHRLDGTLAYFFSVEDLQARCESVGFECESIKYVCNKVVNRKNGKVMKRVFVQSKMIKA